MAYLTPLPFRTVTAVFTSWARDMSAPSATAWTFCSPISTPSSSEPSSVSLQSIDVAIPVVAKPSSSAPIGRPTASQPPRSDQPAKKGTAARSITS